MQKTLLCIAILLTPFISFGQFSFGKESSDTAKGPNNAFEIVSYVDFTSVDTGTYRWLRVQKSLSDKVTSAICDNFLCYGPDDDSAEFYVDANTTFKMKCNFYPNQGCGMNDVTLKVFKPSDPSAGEIFTIFHGYSWCATTGISEVRTKELSLTPSPASNFVNINYGSTVNKYIRVIDILGNVLYETKNHDVSTRLDVSEWSKGIYFVTVQDGSTISNKSFVKK